METQLGDYTINIEVIRKRNKNIYFRFKEDNTLYVTCNRFVSLNDIKKLIKKNEQSLLRLYKKALKAQEASKQFSFLGKPLTIIYDDSIKNLYLEDDYLYTPNETKLNKWLKEQCLSVFQDRIDYWLPKFDKIPAFSLRIRKMTSRWGVNNVTKRIITLNSELIHKDIELVDYVIVHELCHFYEANHSDRFWYQVSLRYPNYKNARKRLRG